MVREGHSIAPALVQEGVSSSPKLSLNFHSDNKTKRPRLGLKLSSVVWDRFSREKKKKRAKCVISVIGRSVSSNPFCCNWAAIRFVWHKLTHRHTQVAHPPCDPRTGPQESHSVCRWSDVSFGSAVRRRMAPDVCPFLQVESLIENEAEKDYLYDVLRMYHQWVPSVCGYSVYVCQQVALSVSSLLYHAHLYNTMLLISVDCVRTTTFNSNW